MEDGLNLVHTVNLETEGDPLPGEEAFGSLVPEQQVKKKSSEANVKTASKEETENLLWRVRKSYVCF